MLYSADSVTTSSTFPNAAEKKKLAGYSATARYTITTRGNVCLRYFKTKTDQFICLKEINKERKKEREEKKKNKKKPRRLCNEI